MEPYHRPVMAAEVVRLLVTDREGIYLDLTVGLGGHLKALAEALGPGARLHGIDRDPQAVRLASENVTGYPQVRKILQGTFGELDTVMQGVGEEAVDGMLLDLGISSCQVDTPDRGFSFRYEGPLDMRFDQQAGTETAADLVNSLDETRLVEIIRSYGEERRARRIAGAIVRHRRQQPIRTTGQLAQIVEDAVSPPYRVKALARVFQAFRIAVNRELHQLETVLPASLSYLKSGGRLAVISYHSLEDRTVKRFYQQQARGCTCPPRLPQCVCGAKPRLRILTRKAVTPGQPERQQNPRARSAKLRVAEKIGV